MAFDGDQPFLAQPAQDPVQHVGRAVKELTVSDLGGSGWAQVRTDWSGRLEARFGAEVTGDLTDAGAAAR